MGFFMIKINEIQDLELINSIMLNPFVLDDISDDKSKGHTLNELPSNFTFHGVFINDECVGFYATHAHNSITVEIHTTLLPSCRGRNALEAGRLIIEKLFTQYEKIISYIADYNKKALIYAQLVGFSIEGTNRNSFLKNDMIHNQYLVGMTKGELKCQ